MKNCTGHIYLDKLSYLPEMFVKHIQEKKPKTIIDFGCGYGYWYHNLRANNLLPRTAIGVNQDQEMCEYAVNQIKEMAVVVGDISKLKFPTARFDMAICNQAIEHTLDDNATVKNIYDSLKSGGSLYISSIIRKPLAWYIYRYNGEVRLSPMHVKEYKNLEEFTSLLTNNGFKILEARAKQYYMKCWSVPLLRGKFGVPLPGFKRCEAICYKP